MKRITLFLCVAISLFSAASPASACSCGRPEPDDYIAGTPVIFRGTVLSVEVVPPEKPLADSRMVTTGGSMRAKFKVAVVFKGNVPEEAEVTYTKSDGRNCGWSFGVGQEVTVFAGSNGKTGFGTSMCTMIPFGSDKRHAATLAYYHAMREEIAAIRETGEPDVEQLRELALFYVRFREYAEAEAAYSRLLTLRPRDVTARIARGMVKYDSANYGAALVDYRAALARDPQNIDARRGQTRAMVKLGKIAELDPKDRDFTGFEAWYGIPVSFAGINLKGANFRDLKLGKVDFSGADLRDADFSGAKIQECNFSGAKLGGAKFENLQGAYNTSFQRAGLAGANFAGVSLTLAKLDNAILDNANFSKADLSWASLERASISKADFRGVHFLNTNLRSTIWDGQDLAGIDLRGSDLREVVFRNTNLRAAIFGSDEGQQIMDMRGTDLSGADLSEVTWGPLLIDCRTKFPPAINLALLPVIPVWTGCTGQQPLAGVQKGYEFQRGPRLSKMDVSGTKLSDVNLGGFAFWDVKADGSDFSTASLVSINISGGSYAKANFGRAQLMKAGISSVSFKDASFDHADLSYARLNAVDFSEARLTGAILTGACFDAKTQWPKGFDPLAAGAKVCR